MRGMSGGLAGMAVALLLLLGAATALAESREVDALGAGLPPPGTGFDEARAISLPQGERLICDSDPDKPRFDRSGYMDPPSGRGAERVRRCAVFVPDAGGVWSLGRIPSLAGPARLWMTFVEQGIAGRYRLAQLSLWAGRDGWDRVAGALEAAWGEKPEGDSRYLHWQSDTSEATMFVDEKDSGEFAVSVSDPRLRRLIRSSGSPIRTE